jgi:hypothetical protein
MEIDVSDEYTDATFRVEEKGTPQKAVEARDKPSWFLDLLFEPEDGCDIFFRNVGLSSS